VLVGTERHLQAEDIAAKAVNAARPEGLGTVAALFAGIAGGVQVRADVTVDVGGESPVNCVKVEVIILSVICGQWSGLQVRFLLLGTNVLTVTVGVLERISTGVDRFGNIASYSKMVSVIAIAVAVTVPESDDVVVATL